MSQLHPFGQLRLLQHPSLLSKCIGWSPLNLVRELSLSLPSCLSLLSELRLLSEHRGRGWLRRSSRSQLLGPLGAPNLCGPTLREQIPAEVSTAHRLMGRSVGLLHGLHVTADLRLGVSARRLAVPGDGVRSLVILLEAVAAAGLQDNVVLLLDVTLATTAVLCDANLLASVLAAGLWPLCAVLLLQRWWVMLAVAGLLHCAKLLVVVPVVTGLLWGVVLLLAVLDVAGKLPWHELLVAVLFIAGLPWDVVLLAVAGLLHCAEMLMAVRVIIGLFWDVVLLPDTLAVADLLLVLTLAIAGMLQVAELLLVVLVTA